ncbi:lysM and putative peptidoglycan-binding domain-containing protein 1 isoform X2 [Gopherus evgoodei]|uniref:lysM and putative peptidoglycan-binding domain-containing protein 1 isoform X2 n=1 Tax=Gopherus evgoodei TaxID=1825980 RepID=UPI0011CF0EB0|nr:lysM and putative peptidoglycan-binding domain-containing protein 1 isoform X2 [Gopherus evgoodei]
MRLEVAAKAVSPPACTYGQAEMAVECLWECSSLKLDRPRSLTAPMEQIKRANRLYTSDSIFLKTTLHIPVPVEPKQMANGLNLEEEEEEAEEGARRPTAREDKSMLKNGSVASTGTTPRHDLSATDFLRKLDLEISLSKKAAVKKLREGEIAIARAEPEASSTVSYQSEPSPHAQQRALLGPVPLTKSIRAATLQDQEDEIFKL